MQGARWLNPRRWVGDPKPRTFRRLMRLFPPIRNSGLKVTHISDDWRHWEMRLKLGLKTRNYVGTHWGGTLYSAADSQFMLAWLHILGEGYVVWDKAAAIRFKRPGRGTLTAEFTIPKRHIQEVKKACDAGPHEREYQMQWRNGDGEVVAEVDKLLYFRKA